MYTEIHPHGSYILLISESCKDWQQNTFGFPEQLSGLSGGKLREWWNPSARFVVSVLANWTLFDSKNISRFILSHFWAYKISDSAVLFLKSTEQEGNELQHNTNDSAQGTYWELHTWYPYENSERCNPAEGTVPVQVFTVRHLSDMNKWKIFKKYFVKNFHKCTIAVHVDILRRLWIILNAFGITTMDIVMCTRMDGILNC
jgi:hypothetical protein